MCLKHVLCMETLLCAAVGTASHQHVFKARTVYGISDSILKNMTAVPNLSVLNYTVKKNF
jgi:hypothetical protein